MELSGIFGFLLILAGVYEGSWVDKVIKTFCFVLYSTPTFWIGLLLLLIFAVNLGYTTFIPTLSYCWSCIDPLA